MVLTIKTDFQSLGILAVSKEVSVKESYVLFKFGIGIHRDTINFGRRAKFELLGKSFCLCLRVKDELYLIKAMFHDFIRFYRGNPFSTS